jgi:hypothetical protein
MSDESRRSAADEPIEAEIVPDPPAAATSAPATSTGAPAANPGPPIAPDYDEHGTPSFDYVRDKIESRYATSVGAGELAADTTEGRPGARPRPPTHRRRQAPARLKILLPSQTSGSYLRSTTRSLSGISALSVILMCSGQTSVQHLVMLQ